MADGAWPIALAAFIVVVVVLLAHRGSGPGQQDDDAWASVRLIHTQQADGCFPVGVVRVQNPALLPVVVSASVQAPRLSGRWRRRPWARRPVSVRSPKVNRRPQVPKGTLLGAVRGGGVGIWEVPLGSTRHLPMVKVRLDQAGPRTTVFTWAVEGSLKRTTRRSDETWPVLAE
jgi:hypothetical protein